MGERNGRSERAAAGALAVLLALAPPALAADPESKPPEGRDPAAAAEREGGRGSYRMDELVVTPGRTEQRLGDVPANVTVLDRGDVRRSAAPTVDDLLRQVPGFSLFRRSSSRVSNPTTQGVTLRGIAPSGVSRSLVLLDGVPLNDPFGGWVYWGRVPKESVERIEVVRGGGSTVWGNAALGGVVNVLTRDPEPRHARLMAAGGNKRTADLEAAVGDVVGPVGVLLEGSRFQTRGYEIVREDQRGAIDEEADSDQVLFRGKLDWAASERARFRLSGSYFREHRRNGTPLTDNDTRTGAVSADGELETEDGSRWNLVAFSQLQGFENTFSSQAADRSSESPALDQFDVPSTAVGAGLQWTKRLFGAHTVTAGPDFRWVDGETRERFRFLEGTFTRNRAAGGEQQLVGGYVQDVVEITPAVQLTAGVRGDVWRSVGLFRRESDLFTGESLVDDRFRDRDETAFSPRVALRWAATDAVSFRGGYYQGFRAPTLNELVRPFRVRNDVTEANSGLEPERLYGGEVGADWALPVALVRLTGFWNEVDDPIANVTLGSLPVDAEGAVLAPCGFLPPGGTCRQRQNLDRTRIRGVEAEVEVEPVADWIGSVSYLFDDATVRDAPTQPELEGKRLAQVPKHQVAIRMSYANPEVVEASVQVRWIGRQFEDDQNELSLGDYAVVDLYVGREVFTGFELFAGVENLFDRTFDAGKSADGIVTIGNPLLVNGGFRLRL